MKKNGLGSPQKIRLALEQIALNIDSTIVARLAMARNRALDHQKAVAADLGLAGIGSISVGGVLLPRILMLMAIAALTLGIAGTYYWNVPEQDDGNVEVDTALLTDDLPVAAYSDQGFQAWLKHSQLE